MSKTTAREYGHLVTECARRGIPKTTAFTLSGSGLLETFLIGKRRFVYIDSLQTLPERLKDQAKAAA